MGNIPALTGKCLCGAVTIRITPAQPHIDVCHCAMCRRWGGGPLLTTRLVTDPDIAGLEHVARYASSDWADRGFCRKCGSHLFYHFKPKDGYSFTAGLFDDLAGFTMVEEIFIDEKPCYYDLAGERKRMTGAEVMANFSAGPGDSS